MRFQRLKKELLHELEAGYARIGKAYCNLCDKVIEANNATGAIYTYTTTLNDHFIAQHGHNYGYGWCTYYLHHSYDGKLPENGTAVASLYIMTKKRKTGTGSSGFLCEFHKDNSYATYDIPRES